ncbi:hypothetical protein IscW_ISCW004770 [Ixodes scapularis]|uniref:Uncharacterized protein n=1 Tax=Ixodes scapularis TaxID=6945 RepID=B7PEN9_IXOSC|nr:hypothetical protein IscW_ISCW004770 [Ixodes scapularis]|eukprot:XP_002433661.1 hypothetical protein IscW_ISCW004770 [Ixodes scapularis]
MLDIHRHIIQIVSDETTCITKDTAGQIFQDFVQMMSICAKRETENEALRAKLEERVRITSYADVLRGRVGKPGGSGDHYHPRVKLHKIWRLMLSLQKGSVTLSSRAHNGDFLS